MTEKAKSEIRELTSGEMKSRELMSGELDAVSGGIVRVEKVKDVAVSVYEDAPHYVVW